ncbi:hypothetical protein EKO27_g1301 [Xylaria grammica]|uniref:Uncharacterized protein n=1 Tax=Xylaria grammica TaxID=363999 RepID=A0A439DHB9_9PEZI|nr:hypothetical protein EKO27_g1301 [Xylaria grammica]
MAGHGQAIEGDSSAIIPNIGDYASSASDIPPQIITIGSSEILRSFQGVLSAIKETEDFGQPVIEWLSMQNSGHEPDDVADKRCPETWRDELRSSIKDEILQNIGLLALEITNIRGKVRASLDISSADLSTAWSTIRYVMSQSTATKGLFKAMRSAQGFLVVPLCSLLKDGNIDELWRFHVWLPGEKRGIPQRAIHSHQAFAQSWIIAGKGTDNRYSVGPTANSKDATHATYALVWTDSTGTGTTYKTHQTRSTVVNTGTMVRATHLSASTHMQGMTYTIPAAAYHSSVVEEDALHATLFVFDSHRGFVQEAYTLGPIDEESSTQLRDPAGISATKLVELADAFRLWEIMMAKAQEYSYMGDLESALRSLHDALHLCESIADFPSVTKHRHEALMEISIIHRRQGRYEQARVIMEATIEEMGHNSFGGMELSGELSIVYRHMNQLEKARQAAQDQYATAKQLGHEQSICRAAGTLGVLYYQMFHQSQNVSLLDVAIERLTERVDIARRLKTSLADSDRDTLVRRKYFTTRELIGLDRLSRCHSARGETKKGVQIAEQSVRVSQELSDSTVLGMSCFFYGLALLADGQRDAALKQFTLSRGCTPAIAFCKEPSEEHSRYLQILVDAGADLDEADEQGYTALDYTTFNGHHTMHDLVLRGLRQSFVVNGVNDVDAMITLRERESLLRKYYREIFQERLRPVLVRHKNRHQDALRNLRQAYSNALAASATMSAQFDVFKYVRYTDFLSFGKMPRSNDTLPGSDQSFARSFDADSAGREIDFVVFISYRWVNTNAERSTPDDKDNTQYNRMIAAVEQLLAIHPSLSRDHIGLWIDHACVDQGSPALGISALPMIVAQCDVLISLVDDQYHSRAWCSVEVKIMQVLKKSYGLHKWYEFTTSVPEGSSDSGKREFMLREGPMDLEINIADKMLSVEEDRFKVLFLERQSRLLGVLD